MELPTPESNELIFGGTPSSVVTENRVASKTRPLTEPSTTRLRGEEMTLGSFRVLAKGTRTGESEISETLDLLPVPLS